MSIPPNFGGGGAGANPNDPRFRNAAAAASPFPGAMNPEGFQRYQQRLLADMQSAHAKAQQQAARMQGRQGTPAMQGPFGPLFFPGAAAAASAADARASAHGLGAPDEFSARQLRRGKWTTEEENYAQMLIECFKDGTLPDAENGTTLRCYLSRKLNCAPMRISKK